MTAAELRRFVNGLLRGRRAKPFDASLEDAAQLRAAIILRSGRPGSAAPSEEFLSGLHGRLRAELEDTSTGGSSGPGPGDSRRRFLQGASTAAAALMLGAVGDHVVSQYSAPQTGSTGDANPGPADVTLNPTVGVWRTVAASEELPQGGVRAFDVGAVNGFLHRDNGQLGAVSGTCTHQGCRLVLDAASRRLDCPCHNAAFAVTGELLRHQLRAAPRPLPHIQVREAHGTIQVYTTAT